MQKATVFNPNNTGYLTKIYPLFLGERPGLYDSINVIYQEILDMYYLQRSLRWTEDEVNLEQSRMDMLPAKAGGKSTAGEIDLMIRTLAYLWELDSVASRAVFPLFAPFITNSEISAMMTEWTAMEQIHALTYSEIIRQCVSDPKIAVEAVVKNDAVLGRAERVIKSFDELAYYGGLLNTGQIDRNDPKLKDVIITGIVSLYLLERVQFMSSFAVIFGLAETNKIIGIAKLVQLICRDELLHARMSSTIIKVLKQDKEWQESFDRVTPDLLDIVDEIVMNELKWNGELFKEGRTMVGLNEQLLNEWVLFCTQDLMSDLELPYRYKPIDKLPITWVMNWIDFDKTQNANQEADNTSYRMNSVKDDLDDDEVFDI